MKTVSLLLIGFGLFFLSGCSEKENATPENTFYIELLNFKKDSLQKNISDGLFGKVAYKKDNKLNIISVNYMVDDFENMHFLRNAAELGKEIENGTQKLSIEFIGDYTIDSITYSIRKYVYDSKQWVNTARLDSVKAITTYQKAKEFAVKEFGKQIVTNAATFTYD